MSTISPHKSFSLSKLNQIKENNYYDENTKKDYDSHEVDQMIFDKQTKESEKQLKKYLKELNQKEIEYFNLRGFKSCTKCKWTLPKKYFSPDNSKKLGLRSHCKFCRNIGLTNYLTVVQCCDKLALETTSGDL